MKWGYFKMKVEKILNKVTVRPTNKKMREAKQTLNNTGILPKEMPVEKKIYIQSMSDKFERIKESIQVSIDNMKGCR